MQQIGYHHFYASMEGPLAKPGAGGRRGTVTALFYFDTDIRSLFPYVNAEADDAQLFKNPDLIRFKIDPVHCVLYPDKCMATPFDSRDEAKRFREKAMAYLNDILNRKDRIHPKYTVFKKAPVTDIIRLLPKTNCRACGYETCIAFAAMVSIQKAQPSTCPFMGNPVREEITYPVLDDQGNQTSTVTLTVDSTVPSNSTRPKPVSSRIDPNRIDPKAIGLSTREMEVLVLVGQGHTNPEISEKLHISPHTVKSHIINLFNKIGVNDRTQAAVWAVRHNII